MATIITINGVDKTSLIDWKSLRREQVLTKEPDKLRFFVRKHSGQSYKPSVGDEVVVTIGGNKEFGGFIVEVTESIEALLEYIEVVCKDYTHELDRQLVSKTYTSQSVDDIISDLIGTFATGFTDTNVDCPVILDKIVFNYLPISKCLQKITELVGDYDWYVDYDKDIHFFASSAETATFNLTDTNGNYVFGSLEIREDTHQLRNEIIVRGGLLTSDTVRSERLTVFPNQRVFPLATKFSTTPAVTINGSSISVGVENLDSATTYTALWNYNEKSLLFSTGFITSTATLIAVALYDYPLILQKRSESSITDYGLFQYTIIDKTIKDLDVAGLRADAELLRYAIPAKTATFSTLLMV